MNPNTSIVTSRVFLHTLLVLAESLDFPPFIIASMTHIRNKDFSISLVRLSHETTRLEHGNPTH